MKTVVGVITSTRADYGLLRPLLFKLRADRGIVLRLFVTGSHLSNEFGYTRSEVEGDGFEIARAVDVLMSGDSPAAITKSIGVATTSFAEVFAVERPDVVVVLGDRYEIFAAATAAFVAGLPLLHLHGGEATAGAMDEAFRHSISKMSALHCVATDEYRRRVIQLGEHPSRVHVVGGLGVDAIKRIKLLNRPALERALGFKLRARNLLITYHPETAGTVRTLEDFSGVLGALGGLGPDTGLVFTYPNADTDGRALISAIRKFVEGRENAVAFASLGQLRYFSCLAQVDAVLGNSSSGLTEAPTFRIPTINIGLRQAGRARASSVIDTVSQPAAVLAAIRRAFSPSFRRGLNRVRNPYGDGGASARICGLIKRTSWTQTGAKQFYDLPLK